jgi:DNA-binding GntR family transcriptional regulator
MGRSSGARPQGTSAVGTAVEAIRAMIRQGELPPGSQVRQQDMAERLDMSRVPIREALHTLKTEGLLRHDRNRGYSVARFNADQLRQVYLMRALLDRALLEQLVWPDEDQLAEITAINAELALAAQAAQVAELAVLNRQFHQAIFNLSPLDLVHDEINRLWEMSDSYRAFYLAGPSRYRTVTEHQIMIDALRRHDLEGLLDTMDRHRTEAQEEVSAMLLPMGVVAPPGVR